MSGHSKWSNNKYRKSMQDSKRNKIFNKIIHKIINVIQTGGNNINYNSKLRVVINEALSYNMSRDILNRVISRTNNDIYDNINIKRTTYEGYGPGRTAVIIECLSKNKNRIAALIRNLFSKFDGNLEKTGSVSYLFNKIGVISLKTNLNDNLIMDFVIESGAEDITSNKDGVINIYTKPELLNIVKHSLQNKGLLILTSKLLITPYIKNQLNKENAIKLSYMIDSLKNTFEVQEVYHNGKIPTNSKNLK